MDEVIGMSDITLVNVLLGFLGPLLVALVVRVEMNAWVKVAIQFAFCAVAGFLTVWAYGMLNGRSLISQILVVLVASSVAYRAIWKPVGTTDEISNSLARRAIRRSYEKNNR